MFTGIITQIGRIGRVTTGRDARRFEVESGYGADTIAIGASISHAGCCVTVIEKGECDGGSWHAFEVSAETLAATTLGTWIEGMPVNLERALAAGEELGGHLVAGHVDAVGRLEARESIDGSLRLRFSAPGEVMRLTANKGSIAVDGVSLTVNEVASDGFCVNVIPHTADATTLGALQPGDGVNLEVDLIARYVARVMETTAS